MADAPATDISALVNNFAQDIARLGARGFADHLRELYERDEDESGLHPVEVFLRDANVSLGQAMHQVAPLLPDGARAIAKEGFQLALAEMEKTGNPQERWPIEDLVEIAESLDVEMEPA